MAQASHAQETQQMRVGFGQSRPPFIFDDHEQGIEIELINAIAKEMGYDVIPSFLPNARGYNSLKNHNLDLYTIATQNLASEFHLSDTYMLFENVLISKANNPDNISQFSDIRGKRLAAFQGAHFLVKEINDIKDSLSLYIETSQQSRQIQLLYKDRVDYLFSERKIFEFNLKRAVAKGEIMPLELAYKIHHIVPKTLYSAAFNDPLLRDKFNVALRALVKNGRYKQIIRKYDIGFKRPMHTPAE
jgi:polar amino acid transport system substrate-binding protein|tara:strand:+ start:125548 stop:126282 length:735 start_codon:yes stop_codon:yes gene_type:complete